MWICIPVPSLSRTSLCLKNHIPDSENADKLVVCSGEDDFSLRFIQHYEELIPRPAKHRSLLVSSQDLEQ